MVIVTVFSSPGGLKDGVSGTTLALLCLGISMFYSFLAVEDTAIRSSIIIGYYLCCFIIEVFLCVSFSCTSKVPFSVSPSLCICSVG